MTYSIIAIDSRKEVLGIAVASGSIAVGSRVPWVERGVGAIATQGYTNISYGFNGLKLLKQGYSPGKALLSLLNKDPEREKRQVGIIDIQGRIAVHTGKECPEWRGHLIGKTYLLLGNYLVGYEVLKDAEEAFNSTEGTLVQKLLEALVAGEKAGGDRRGNRSAAILVRGGIEITEVIDNADKPTQRLYSLCRKKYAPLFQ
ncbi:MAG: DUF1028 domain-containing protein [Candidatus Njordarchaeales archaeon]